MKFKCPICECGMVEVNKPYDIVTTNQINQYDLLCSNVTCLHSIYYEDYKDNECKELRITKLEKGYDKYRVGQFIFDGGVNYVCYKYERVSPELDFYKYYFFNV